MNRTVMWSSLRWPGSEHTVVQTDDAGSVTVDGMVILAEDRPARLHYRLACDPTWEVRLLEIDLHGGPAVSLAKGPDGTWSDDAGPRPDLAGCVDVDISVTPFTNTLPIRRLSLAPGTSADARMVYVLIGRRLEVTTSDQRYTHLESRGTDSVYRYESGDFRADLTVDADGLVMDYPGLWRREPVA